MEFFEVPLKLIKTKKHKQIPEMFLTNFITYNKLNIKSYYLAAVGGSIFEISVKPLTNKSSSLIEV